MATWMTHLRVAEGLLKKYNFNSDNFLVGNIAPDSGLPDGNGGFTPSKIVTHFKDGGRSYNLYDHINPELFFNKYIFNQNQLQSNECSFLIGYYVHLITDVYWHQLIMVKIANDPLVKEVVQNTPSEFRRELKLLDLLYSRKKVNIFTSVFMCIDSARDYLKYFPKNAISRHINHIKSFYLDDYEFNNILNESKITLRSVTKDELDQFVTNAVHLIDIKLSSFM